MRGGLDRLDLQRCIRPPSLHSPGLSVVRMDRREGIENQAPLRAEGQSRDLVRRDLGSSDHARRIYKLKREVPDDVLVLPSHNDCFRGLHARLDYLAASQHRTLDRLRKTLQEPCRAVQVFVALFGRVIEETDGGLLNLATGESIACLNYLVHRGEARRTLDAQGVAWYQMI